MRVFIICSIEDDRLTIIAENEDQAFALAMDYTKRDRKALMLSDVFDTVSPGVIQCTQDHHY